MNDYENEILRKAVETAVVERGPEDSVDTMIDCVIVYMEDWTGRGFWSEDKVLKLINAELKKV